MKQIRCSAFALSLVLILSLSLGSIAAADPPTPAVRLEPTDQTIDLDQETTVEVWVDDAVSFYGIEFELAFDETILEGIGVVEGTAFTDHPDEYELLPTNGIFTNTVKFAAHLLRVSKAAPLDGDLHLATITFRGIGAGTSPLTWETLKLSDGDGFPIDHTFSPGSITVQAAIELATVTGQGLLEARSTHPGIAVTLSNSVTLTTTTDASGWYTFTEVPSDTYDLTLAHPLYLTTTLQSCPVQAGETAWMPTVTLYGGDLNGDGVIDISDLTILGSHFETAAPEADINADGVVDIFDAVLIGKNFGLTAPVIALCAP